MYAISCLSRERPKNRWLAISIRVLTYVKEDWAEAMGKLYHDHFMYTVYGPPAAVPYRSHAWPELDRRISAFARITITNQVPLKCAESQLSVGTSLKKKRWTLPRMVRHIYRFNWPSEGLPCMGMGKSNRTHFVQILDRLSTAFWCPIESHDRPWSSGCRAPVD